MCKAKADIHLLVKDKYGAKQVKSLNNKRGVVFTDTLARTYQGLLGVNWNNSRSDTTVTSSSGRKLCLASNADDRPPIPPPTISSFLGVIVVDICSVKQVACRMGIRFAATATKAISRAAMISISISFWLLAECTVVSVQVISNAVTRNNG